jgi:hypothetical protein
MASFSLVLSTVSTIFVSKKKPCQVIDLERKLKVIKYYKGGKSVMVIPHQSSMSHSTIDTTLKNKNKVQEAVKESASLKEITLTKIQEKPVSDIQNF